MSSYHHAAIGDAFGARSGLAGMLDTSAGAFGGRESTLQ
jgi:hypothetical protein